MVAVVASSVLTWPRARRITESRPVRLSQRSACVPPHWLLYGRPPSLQVRRESLATRHRPAVCSQVDRDNSQLQSNIQEAAAVLRDLRAAITWDDKVVTLRHLCG